MSDLRRNFKEKVIVPYNKYNTTQYKLGKIVSSDKKKDTCTIQYKNNKGVLVEAQDIPVKSSLTNGFFGGFPKAGERVELEETNNTVRIVGLVNQSDIKTQIETDDNYSGASSMGGYMGI